MKHFYQQTPNLFVQFFPHSVLLNKGPAAVFNRERKRANSIQYDCTHFPVYRQSHYNVGNKGFLFCFVFLNFLTKYISEPVFYFYLSETSQLST